MIISQLRIKNKRDFRCKVILLTLRGFRDIIRMHNYVNLTCKPKGKI